MKIYINGLFFNGSGIGRYYKNLVREFALRDINVITTIPSSQREKFINLFGNFKNIRPFFVDYDKFSLRGLVLEGLLLKKLEKEVDLFFFPHVNVPIYIPERAVVTVHDLIPFTNFWEGNNIKKYIFKYYFDRAIKAGKYIITVSEYTKKELMKYRKDIAGKIEVIYHFLDERFFQQRDSELPPLLSEPYLLYVGARKRHKNLGVLLKALKILSKKIPHKLVIAGPKVGTHDEVDEEIIRLDLRDRVVEYIKPDDDELCSLYKHADLFIFPSFIEGFGLPPLEAVASGCPAVVSDIEVHREVFGESGLYFKPDSPEELSNIVLKVALHPGFRKELLSKQQERLNIFNKEAIIEKYFKLFGQVIR